VLLQSDQHDVMDTLRGSTSIQTNGDAEARRSKLKNVRTRPMSLLHGGSVTHDSHTPRECGMQHGIFHISTSNRDLLSTRGLENHCVVVPATNSLQLLKDDGSQKAAIQIDTHQNIPSKIGLFSERSQSKVVFGVQTA
jgi:hypothetical protein